MGAAVPATCGITGTKEIYKLRVMFSFLSRLLYIILSLSSSLYLSLM